MWKPTKSQVVTYNFIDIIKVIFHLDSSEYCEKILWNLLPQLYRSLKKIFPKFACQQKSIIEDETYLSVPLQLLVELRWLVEGGLVPAVDPGAVLQAPRSGASPELARVTLVGNFNRPLKSFLRAFLDRSNSLAAELTFAALLMYDVEMLSWDDEK
jgi:hypothetical protein